MRNVFCVVCLASMAACHDDKYDGPSPYDVNATYTNQLNAGNNANLALLYNGEAMIGKEAYFKLKDAHTGFLSLKQILPGEQETDLDEIALTTDGESYSFGGTAVTAAGTSLAYAGKVEPGKLTLVLSHIDVAESLLKGKQLGLVKTGDAEYGFAGAQLVTQYHTPLLLRMQLKTPLGSSQAMLGSMLPVLNALAAQAGGIALNTVLNKIRFGTDGNLTADYASWPEGLSLDDAMAYSRPDEDYTASPSNLAMYYFAGAETMFVVPNIDQVIYTVMQNQARQNRSEQNTDEMQELLTTLYAQLAVWARYGVRFTALPNPYTGDGYAPVYTFDDNGNRIVNAAQADQYEGDYLLRLENDQLAVVGVLVKALPYFAPDVWNTPLSEVESLAAYAMYIQMLFPGVSTVGDLLTALMALAGNMDFEIGLLLNN